MQWTPATGVLALTGGLVPIQDWGTATTAIVAGAGRFGAILWVKPRDVKRAAKALGVG